MLEEGVSSGDRSSLFISDVSRYGVDLALAEELMTLGSYEDAEKLALEAITLARNTKDSHNVYGSFASGILGDILLAEGKYEAAAKTYRKALRDYEAHYVGKNGPAEVELLGALNLIGSLYMDKEMYDEAVEAFKSELNVTRGLQLTANETFKCINRLAAAYYHNGSLEDAEALYNQSLSFFNEHFTEEEKEEGEQIVNLAVVFTGLGHIFYDRGSFDMAEDYYEMVSDLFFKSMRNNDLSAFAPAFKNLAYIKIKQRNWDEAETLIRQALHAIGDITLQGDFDPKDTKLVKDLKYLLKTVMDVSREPNT